MGSTWVLALVIAVDAAPAPVVRGHTVAPEAIAPGGAAVDWVTVWAPDGVRLSVRDADGADGDVERLGSWSLERAPEAGGGVTWRFERRTTAWTPGSHRTPDLQVSVSGGSTGPRILDVKGVALRVSSPLPDDARLFQPAPAEGPPPSAPYWPGLWTVVPLVLATGSGVAWRRSRGRNAPSAPGAATVPRVPSLGEALAGAPAEAGPRAAHMVAAVRVQPGLVRQGVRASDTTAQVLDRCGTEVDGLEELLRLADGWRYGAVAPEGAVVDETVRRVVEALSHG